jgi:hypothetical protein
MFLTAFRRACGAALRWVRLLRPGACSLALRLFAVLTVLAACSPTYDWRTVSNDASGYSVDLPAKPRSDQRDVEIDGTSMHMRMQTAEVDDVLFVVGTVALPDARPATQQRALAFLRNGLARNVGVAPDARDVAVPVAAGGAIRGIEMRLTGKAGEAAETRTIHARLVAKDARVYEVAIVARAEPPVEQVDQFFQSFRLH